MMKEMPDIQLPSWPAGPMDKVDVGQVVKGVTEVYNQFTAMLAKMDPHATSA